MSSRHAPRRALLASALALAFAAPASAAVIVNESFDGAWFNPQQSGRGLLVDVIPGANGSKTFFGALFTYDNAGNPLWLTIQPVLGEFDFSATNVEVRRFAGGNFGNTFTPPNPGAGTVIGSANLTVNSCGSLQLDITPQASANLSNVNLALQPLQGIPAACAWTQTFTACPTGTTAVANQPRTCRLSGTLTGNVTLPNNATYLIDGKVQVGQPMNAAGVIGTTGTLTIEPGTLLRGAGGSSDYLVVNPGSQILADGTRDAPIIFTGPTEAGGSWAGLLIAGRAPVNNAGAGQVGAVFEADANVVFGGTLPNDSSGILRYVQVRHGGQTIAANRELNTITFGAVGAGTVVEYVQAHNGTDDGFEFFGGTVNGRYLVSTGNDDDSFDFDTGGYTGSIQFAYARPDQQIDTADGRCIEADNQPENGNLDATPRGQPKVANLSCIGATTGPNWFEGIRLRRGITGQFWNVVVANATNSAATGACIRFNNAATYNAIGTPPSNTTMQGSFLGSCATNFRDDSAVTNPPITVANWFASFGSNATGDAAAALNGRFARAGGPLTSGAVQPSGAFFSRTTYRGAFDADSRLDWAAGWTAPGSL